MPAARPLLAADGLAMTLLLGALVAAAPVAMDIYLPSMPAMTQALGATADEVHLTLTVYMFGWGVAQLFAGPVSDRYGRRPALVVGLVVFTAASLACALARDAATLIAARLVQSMALATVAVVPRAVVRDLASGDRAAHMLSTMMLVLAVAPVAAPIAGAQLHVLLGWQANFVFVALYGGLLLVAVLARLPETLQARDPRALNPRAMLANWAQALASRRFTGFLLVTAFMMAGLFAFLAGSAFVFVEGFGEGERAYGAWFGLVMTANFVGASIARRVVRRIGLDVLVARGAMLAVAAGAAMTALAWLDVRHPLAVAGPMFAYQTAYMCMVPQATAGALTPFPQIAGSASSLLSFASFVVAASAALAVGLAFDGSARPMAVAILAGAVLAAGSYRAFLRR